MQIWQTLEHLAYWNIFFHKWDLLWLDSAKECFPTCWELWKAKEPSSNMVPLESKVWIFLWHVLLKTCTELEELMQEVERYNLSDMSKDRWIHSTPGLPEVADFPRCNNAEIEWYGRMPTDPPLVNPKVEMLLQQCEREKMPPQEQPSL